jgi:hypothetical protein
LEAAPRARDSLASRLVPPRLRATLRAALSPRAAPLQKRRVLVDELEAPLNAMRAAFHGREAKAKLDADSRRELHARATAEADAAARGAGSHARANSDYLREQGQAQATLRREQVRRALPKTRRRRSAAEDPRPPPSCTRPPPPTPRARCASRAPQDLALGSLSGSLSRVNEMAVTISSELKEQEKILDDVETSMDAAQGKMDGAIAGIEKLLKTKDKCQLMTICSLTLVFIILACIAMYIITK